jgi:hypothetical protein
MALTVKDLKYMLAGLDDDLRVIVAKDNEGNGYSPLVEVEPAFYEIYSPWSGEYFHHKDTDRPDDSKPAVFLWPTN